MLLQLHVLAGFLSFFVAPLALITQKGGKAHRMWGKIFFWNMTLVCATALILAPVQGNVFLTLIAVFSFYMAYSGYRSLYRKKLFKGQSVHFADWTVAALQSLFGICLIVYGIIRWGHGMGLLALVFGLIAMLLGISDLKSFLRPPSAPKKWFFDHMTRMIGAYIVAVSAFSAVNLNFDWLPVVIQWLWPSIIGVPGMIY